MRGLFQYIHAPAPPSIASLLGTALLIVGAGYCVTWGVMQGQIVGVDIALAWAVVSVLPWYGAFEVNKRVLRDYEDLGARIAALAASLLVAMVASALLQKALFSAHGHPIDALALHLVRHGQETVIVALLSIVAALLASRPVTPRAANDRELPVAAERIRWIKSAGNYVEIATPARVEMHRMTLAEAERLLDPAAFVRVNRTTIVARALIVRVKPGAKAGLIELQDGRAVPIGQAYRANFADAA
jgi:DNA-binding LytR/AlgR family response regulator